MYEYDEENDSGYGGLAALLGGAALISPYGKPARRLVTKHMPDWALDPLAKGGERAGHYASRALSGLTGGASDLAAKTSGVKSRFGKANTDRFATEIRDELTAKDMEFQPTLQDRFSRYMDLSNKESKEKLSALKDFVSAHLDVPLKDRYKNIKGGSKVKQKASDIKAAATSPQKKESMKAGRTNARPDQVLKGEAKTAWTDFTNSNIGKSLDQDELNIIGNIFAHTPEVESPLQAAALYASILSKV